MDKDIKCKYCKGTGKIKVPKDKEMFDYLIDLEMNKGDFISYKDAEETVSKKVKFIFQKCPYCQNK